MFCTYINKPTLVSPGEEFRFILSQRRTCYNGIYPYKIFPEKSLSIELQQDLCEYIQASARYYGCQFVIANHSPVLLAMADALIYDLDSTQVQIKKWTELESVHRYFAFFE